MPELELVVERMALLTSLFLPVEFPRHTRWSKVTLYRTVTLTCSD